MWRIKYTACFFPLELANPVSQPIQKKPLVITVLIDYIILKQITPLP